MLVSLTDKIYITCSVYWVNFVLRDLLLGLLIGDLFFGDYFIVGDLFSKLFWARSFIANAG